MSEQLRFSPSMTWQNSAWISPDQYQKMYQESVANPEKFWGDQAKILDWFKPWDRVKSTSFQKPVHIQWYQGGELNVAYNCIDRHLSTKKNQPAIIWEPDSPSEPAKTITYDELSASVAKFCHILKKYGVKKGDRVTIYLPMIPEAAFAMLACARMGAIHNVVFGGFSPDSLADRILDSESDFLITANEGLRAGKTIPLKANADLALKKCPQVRHCLVVKRTESEVPWTPGRDIPYNSELAKAPSEFPAESFSSETPLFILYTSGSTNKPKGVLHTSGGYLVYAALTHKFVFDYKPGDIYWCTADVGWVTGHSYMIYGPLTNGATTLLFEGVPTWPQASRIWEVVDKHKVNILYTAPTLIRSLISLGDHHVTKTSRKSLKLLGSVGEPINPEAWLWYHDKVGESRCPVVDTWWQTETGGILITPLPGVSTLKPGSATRPFFGIQPAVLNDKGQEVSGAAEGVLVIKDSWPGQMRTVYKDHARFEETYFSAYPGYYFSGDGCRRDEDGDFWITGRVDDVLNVSGHRMGTAEIESALDAHPGVAETAVVGFPHDIKGQGIYCYVTLVHGVQPSDELKAELQNFVRDEIGPIAKPDVIQWAPALPKTRSGKIMRRILRKIAEKRFDQLGDTSTLADPAVVEDLIRNRPS